jgi:hemolysin activation/secretion protein
MRATLIAGCVILGLQAAPAAAQLPQLPPTPGAVQDTIVPQKPPAPAAPGQLVFPTTPPPVEHDPKGQRFTVNAFAFTGNTVFPEQALKQYIERYLDLQLNLHDLSRAADSITRLYQENGYPVARAVLPAQKVEKGIVRFEIIEGRVGELRFEGNKRYSTSYLQAFLSSLPSGGLITTAGLEHDLLLLNGLPGLTARAVLEPGQAFGTSDVTIKVEEKLLSAFVVPNNFGLEETGQWRVDAGASINSLLGLGDQTSYYGIRAQNGLLNYDSLTYAIPVTPLGTRLELNYSQTDYRVGGQFTALGLDGESNNREARLVHPYLLGRAQNLLLNLGLRQTRMRQRALGVQLSEDKVTVVNFGATYNQIGQDSSLTNGSAQFTTNNEDNSVGTRRNAVRFKMLLDGNHLRGLSREWDFFMRGVYGFSVDPLPDSEKFALGGPGSVRGYRPSELRGDGVALFTSELRRQLSIGNVLGTAGLFYDVGSARYKAPGFVEGTVTIQSVGANVTFYLRPGIQTKLEFAAPVGNTIQSDGKNARAWFSISASF